MSAVPALLVVIGRLVRPTCTRLDFRPPTDRTTVRPTGRATTQSAGRPFLSWEDASTTFTGQLPPFAVQWRRTVDPSWIL